MLVLSLDTSADLAVGVVEIDDDLTARPLAVRTSSEQRRHAELLAPMVAAALEEAGVARTRLDAVVVGTGPAPFTGLRAGLVTARVLAHALGVPVLGVPSLDALAAAAATDDASEVVVVTDARRREVYAARYRVGREGATGRSDVTAVAGPLVERPDRLAQDGLLAGARVVGPAVPTYAAALGLPDLAGSAAGPGVDPVVLARLAVGRRRAGEDLPTEPLYLRRPDVTPSAARKRVTG